MNCRFYSADDLRRLTDKFNDRETILIAEGDNRILGWGMIKRYSDRLGYRVCCEISIYPSLSETGKGYGGLLQAPMEAFSFVCQKRQLPNATMVSNVTEKQHCATISRCAIAP